MVLESLFLGLLAWFLPLWYCLRPQPRRFGPVLLGSGAACGGALLLQLEEVRRRVVLRDWSALMDTTDAVVHAAVVLLAVTVLLDLLAVLIHRSASPAL